MKSWYKTDTVDLRSGLLVEFTAQVDFFGGHLSGRLQFQRWPKQFLLTHRLFCNVTLQLHRDGVYFSSL